MEIVLSNLSLIELKAHAYDEIQKIEVVQNTLKKIIETSQNNLKLLNAEIVTRSQQPPVVVTPPVEPPKKEEKPQRGNMFVNLCLSKIKLGPILTNDIISMEKDMDTKCPQC